MKKKDRGLEERMKDFQFVVVEDATPKAPPAGRSKRPKKDK